MLELLEREDQLDSLHRLFDQAAAGSGHLVFLGAEAGAGKTALVQAFGDSVASRARVLTGWCDPLSAPRPAGPLVDMAHGLGDPVRAILSGEGRAGLFDATVRRPDDLPAAHRAGLRGRALGRRDHARPAALPRPPGERRPSPRDRDLPRRRGRSRPPAAHPAGRPGHPGRGDPDSTSRPCPRRPSPPWRPVRRWTPPHCGPARAATRSTSPSCCRPPVDDVPATVADAVVARAARLSPRPGTR